MKKSRREFLIKRAFAILVTASLVITFSLICDVPRALAQSTTASLSGTVVDPSGAVIPGATVTISNPDTGFTREVTASDDGIYTFPSLAPSTYTVTGRSTGFASVEIKDVVLNVNDKRSLQIQLRVGDVGEVIQVTTEASLVDESPAVSTVIDRTLVERLPLPGRSFQGLIALSPGVVLTESVNSDQGQFSVNGQRRSSNAFYVDGVSANFGGASAANLGQFASGSLPAFSAQGGTNSLVSVDSVEEFTIQTSTYAAEFGRQPGAQISILTRSGTNKFHGSVFEYYRNEKLDANDFFVNARPLTALQISQGLTKQPRAPLSLNQFGGVFGGPLYLPNFGKDGPMFISGRDRTFFFFSYEGVRLTQPQNIITDVPTLATRQAAPAALQPFLNAFPLPNGPVSLTDPTQAEFSTAFSDPSDLDTYSIRIDHIVNKRLQIFGRYNDSISNNLRRAFEGGPANNVYDNTSNTRTLTLGAISPFTSSLVNDFRFNYSRNVAASEIFNDTFGGAVPFPSSALFASTPPPFTEDNGLFAFLVFGGRNQSFFLGKNTSNTQKQLNIVNHLSVVKGNHSLRFGVDYRTLSPEFSPREYVGVVAYLGFADVIAGRVLQVQTQQSREGGFFFKNVGLYAQDTWRAKPRLTLTYGLRWDVDSSPTLSDGLQPFTVTSAGFDDPTQFALAPSGSPLFKTTYNNFAPRIGVSYQLRQKAGQETVLRGGFGVFYDLASQYVGQIAQTDQPPFGAVIRITAPPFGPLDPVFGIPQFPIPPNQAAQPPINLNPPLINTFLTNPELVLPRSLQWNLAVEQSLGTNQTLSVSYVASKGSRLLQQEAVNGAVNATFSNPILIDNTADSDYHSMQAQFQRRLTRGLQTLASYTWAHSIDSASTAGFSGTNNFSRSRPGANRASSDFDIRHAFNAAVSYNLPAPFKNRALRGILGGWSTDTIFVARTAPPVTVTTFGLLAPFETATIRPDVVPGVPIFLFGDQFPGGRAFNPAAFARPPTALVGGVNRATRQGTASRNQFRGFGAWQVDFSLRREFSLGESVRLQFRGEFFNVFNHPNFGRPDTGLGFRRLVATDPTSPFIPNPSPTFGRTTSMLGRSLLGPGASGGFSPLFQIGGPRSAQLSLKLVF